MKKDRNHSEDTYQPSNHHFTLTTAPPICSYPLNSPYDVFSSSMLREIRLKFTKHQDGDSIAILMLDMSEIPCLCIVHPTFRSIFQTIQCKELSCTCRQGWGVFHQPFILGNTTNSPIIPVDMCSWVKGFGVFLFPKVHQFIFRKKNPLRLPTRVGGGIIRSILICSVRTPYNSDSFVFRKEYFFAV